ncbi:hypothetical protein C1H46_007099 [Malus baccata]|uniref:Uncharacterized protein n=1 Tax=Malus baccata TaxID=106549 RepID=A0A540N8A9_MALBA|nr:hypothetical protein C1H46_007099 [Malus baccata]
MFEFWGFRMQRWNRFVLKVYNKEMLLYISFGLLCAAFEVLCAQVKSRIYPFCTSVRHRRKEGDGWHSSSASLGLKKISQAAIISR